MYFKCSKKTWCGCY